ncbi:MAG: prepilin-type N-terminal cleavage/methylation domain-containing protein [Gammaproteobacteria bacterium]|nr:MAG: prepilin-type N-terminal cleavage/methylation domain-containing protein [Gammaproteobacteria bacterium]
MPKSICYRGVMETKTMAKGFTLIELLITIALMAIILAFAGPGFQELIQRNQVRSITDEFFTGFNMARSEAIKRNTQVTICASSTGASCDAANWDSGWAMFVDENGDGDVNGAEPVVQTGSQLPGGYTLRGTASVANSITLNPDGSVRGIAGSFRVCSPEADVTKSRAIKFLQGGRPRMEEGTDQCP